MKRILIITALTLLLTLAACSLSPTISAPEPEIDLATFQKGERVFQANCSACHSTTSKDVLVGPSMIGLASRSGEIVDGLDARSYIEQSILEPGAFLNEGFQNLMPATYATTLNEEDLNALIEYLLTFE